jgi:hypothetical protein
MTLNPEFVNHVADMCKDVKMLALKKLVLFLFVVQDRVKKLDWNEWIGRNLEGRERLRFDLYNYLAEQDMVEAQFYAKLLGWNVRTVIDYWETLRLLSVFIH